MPALPEHTRRCTGCGGETAFSDLARRGGDRRASICKPCDAKRWRDRYWADPVAGRERSRRYRLLRIEDERARARAYAASDRGRQVNRAAVAKWQATNPEAVRAHRAVAAAIARGEIVRPDRCTVVGCDRPARHAHHANYARPLAVEHLCVAHHEALHHTREPLPVIRQAGDIGYARPPVPPSDIRP